VNGNEGGDLYVIIVSFLSIVVFCPPLADCTLISSLIGIKIENDCKKNKKS